MKLIVFFAISFLQEEQRVIEAQIRMRQQELQDEEERMQKRQELSSSSTAVAPGEVQYSSVAGINLLQFCFFFPVY